MYSTALKEEEEEDESTYNNFTHYNFQPQYSHYNYSPSCLLQLQPHLPTLELLLHVPLPLTLLLHPYLLQLHPLPCQHCPPVRCELLLPTYHLLQDVLQPQHQLGHDGEGLEEGDDEEEDAAELSSITAPDLFAATFATET